VVHFHCASGLKKVQGRIDLSQLPYRMPPLWKARKPRKPPTLPVPYSMPQKKISRGVVHEVPADLKEALAGRRSVGLSQLKEQKPEAAGSSGAVARDPG